MNYDNRCYLIFNVNEIDKVDFRQVLETSAETLRKSVDGSRTFVKWDVQVLSLLNAPPGYPTFYDDLVTKEGPYTHEEMLGILSGSEWSPPIPAPPEV